MDQRRRGGDGLSGPSPIQLAIADTLNAGKKFNGVLEPRRTTKTTSIEAVILGRCTFREDYQAGWTLAKADGGQKTGERFRKDIVTHIDRQWPDKSSRPFVVNLSKGSEHIRWPNGSYFNIYAPGNDAFTSGAFDFAWVDEGQDATPEMSEAFLTSIPPTLDGRFQPQMVVSGTAPDYQDMNLLWHILHMEGGGHIQHGVPEETDPELLDSWETVEPLVLASHPGIGFTTPLSDVRDNFNAMTSKAFQREYLSIPGAEGSNVSLINQPKWQASALDFDSMEVPKVFSMAMFVHPDALYASVAASWVDGKGKTHVCLLHHQEGVQGFAKKLILLERKHKRAITWDQKSDQSTVVMNEVRDARPRPQERPLGTRDNGRAAVNFMNLLNQDQLRHYDQPEMNGAAEIAVKRTWNHGNGWSFGRPTVKGRTVFETDITPIEAASMAVYVVGDERDNSGGVKIDFFE